MTPAMIAGIVGVIVSLCLQYIPKFKDWYNALADTYQKLFTLGIGLVVVFGAFGLGCANVITQYWPCTGQGAITALGAFLAYIGANQATYALFLKNDTSA